MEDAGAVSAARIISANELAWLRWRSAAKDSPVPQWMRSRGLDPGAATAAGWQLGWAGPEWRGTADLLERHGVPLAVGAAAGLVRRAPSGRVYDVFRGRVVLPVRHLVDGRIAGFTARSAVSDPAVPKYLNSPASAAYRKGSLLFGAWEARQRRRADPGSVAALVLCEGPLDALNVSSCGPWAGVAACGTALSTDQAEWLAALSNGLDVPLVLAYDGDEAGRRAEVRAWDLLKPAMTRQLRVADIPEGRDPGDLDCDALTAAIGPLR